jgi:hypothetical protein
MGVACCSGESLSTDAIQAHLRRNRREVQQHSRNVLIKAVPPATTADASGDHTGGTSHGSATSSIRPAVRLAPSYCEEVEECLASSTERFIQRSQERQSSLAPRCPAPQQEVLNPLSCLFRADGSPALLVGDDPADVRHHEPLLSVTPAGTMPAASEGMQMFPHRFAAGPHVADTSLDATQIVSSPGACSTTAPPVDRPTVVVAASTIALCAVGSQHHRGLPPIAIAMPLPSATHTDQARAELMQMPPDAFGDGW